MSEFIMTDELRKKASEKQKLNILFITDGDSRLSTIRNEVALRGFARFYARTTEVSYQIAPSSKLATVTDAELNEFNVLWLDNISDYRAAMNMGQFNDKLMTTIDPEWKTTLNSLKDDIDEYSQFIESLLKKRQDKIRYIYSLDEFIWDAPMGRAKELKRVQVIESILDLCDTIIVPNAELRDFILPSDEPDVHWPGLVRENKDVVVIPTALSPEFFQLYKNFKRVGAGGKQHDKPRVLVKGITIPENVQEFIIDNHRKMDITVSSIGEVNEHLMGLLSTKKVSHIMHWAHPHVNKHNMLDTMAIERDSEFDVVIHTKPDQMNGEYYEITAGYEDILFSIACGSVVICGTEHLEYPENHISYVSGYVFGPDTPAKYLRNVITTLVEVPVKFNEALNKCRSVIETRLVTSGDIMGRYYAVMCGPELTRARNQLIQEAMEKAKAEQEQESTESIELEQDDSKIIPFPKKEG